MKTVEVKASLRETLGKSNSKNLRKEDQIPCVLYGSGENVHFHTHENSFKEIHIWITSKKYIEYKINRSRIILLLPTIAFWRLRLNKEGGGGGIKISISFINLDRNGVSSCITIKFWI